MSTLTNEERFALAMLNYKAEGLPANHEPLIRALGRVLLEQRAACDDKIAQLEAARAAKINRLQAERDAKIEQLGAALERLQRRMAALEPPAIKPRVKLHAVKADRP